VDIRYVFRQTQRGILVKIDDDMIRYYCNGDVFIMKVLATEEATSGHVFYDVAFIETSPLPQPTTAVHVHSSDGGARNKAAVTTTVVTTM
jgi:hypothetical protein